jgi:hypothetical protein
LTPGVDDHAAVMKRYPVEIVDKWAARINQIPTIEGAACLKFLFFIVELY